MSEIEELLDKIKDLRQVVGKLVNSKGEADPEVIAISQKLDRVLNEYYKLLKEKS